MNRMKSFFAALMLLTLALPVGAQSAQSADAPAAKSSSPQKAPPPAIVPKSWQKVPIPPLRAFKPQQPRRIELENGMVIFLQEDHELPLIDGTIRIRGGSREEPADKIGLVAIY